MAAGAQGGAPAPAQRGDGKLQPWVIGQMAGDQMAQTAAPQRSAQPPRQQLEPLPIVRRGDSQLPAELEGPRLSLSFSQPISVAEIVRLLVHETKLSVVISPGVDEKLTFQGELNDVTVREALDLILHPLGLDYAVQGRVIRIFTRQPEIRIFNIDYVATQRSGTRSMSATTGAGGTAAAAAGAGAVAATGVGGGAGGVGAGGAAGAGGSSASVSGTESVDLFEELATGIQNLLSEGGKFNLDRKAALLQVIDFPDVLQRVEFYLESVMRRVQRQVLIEAKVVEVELRDQFSAGINWSLILGSRTGNNVTLSQSLAPTTSGAFTIATTFKNLTSLISAFETQGKVNVLSSPRVSAMNNEPALIRVGTQDVFFVTTTQVEPGTGRLLQTAVVPQTITEGVVLSVTPQVSSDGIIHMSVSPSVTERTGQATSRLGDTVPIISVRETDTLVRVHQGETVVIAGLMQDRFNVDSTKVPVLGDLPGIGAGFRRKERTTRKTDLVILLTATILSPDQRAVTAADDLQRIEDTQRTPVPRPSSIIRR